MSEESTTVEAVRYWWEKALASVEAARRELEAEDYAFAINRAYYALFYAVSGLFLEEGRQFGKHSRVRSAFNRDVVKLGRLSEEHGKLYNQLFRDRQEGDYIEFTKFDALYVQEKINSCEKFLAALRPLIKSLPPDESGAND